MNMFNRRAVLLCINVQHLCKYFIDVVCITYPRWKIAKISDYRGDIEKSRSNHCFFFFFRRNKGTTTAGTIIARICTSIARR